VLLSSRGAAAAAAAAAASGAPAAAASVAPSSLLGRALRLAGQPLPEEAGGPASSSAPPPPGADAAAAAKSGGSGRGAAASAFAPLAATPALVPPRWLKRANAAALRTRSFPRVLGGRQFPRPEHVWAMAARVLAETPAGEEVRPGPYRALAELFRVGAPADWAAACEPGPDAASAAAAEGSGSGSLSAESGGSGGGDAVLGAFGGAEAAWPRLRVVDSPSSAEGKAFALVRADGVVAAVPPYARAIEALADLAPPLREGKAERAAARARAAESDAELLEAAAQLADDGGAHLKARDDDATAREEAPPARTAMM